MYNGAVIQEVAACANHPQREAIGICVQCRTRICAECVTKVDGINHCVSCLARRAVVAKPAAKAKRVNVHASRLSAAAHLGALWFLCWILLEALLPGGR